MVTGWPACHAPCGWRRNVRCRKGGQQAICKAHQLLAAERRADPDTPELTTDAILGQLRLGVDRVMTEGSLYDPELAALAVKQAWGDLVEAVFLLRAYRTTLPRLAATLPVDTGAMAVRRRISAAYKDLPGGQRLGPTFDYTHRLLDFSLLAEAQAAAPAPAAAPAEPAPCPRVSDFLAAEGLLEPTPEDSGKGSPGDLTREPLALPAGRDLRLQNLARGDEGFLLAMGYSTQRGFGSSHPFCGEIRMGEVEVAIEPEELGFPVVIGELTVTECQLLNKTKAEGQRPPCFTQGYGLAFGYCERKAMAMALVDRALRERELKGEADPRAPAQDEEFVLMHSDNVEAQGFVQHLKLPHYVDFQGEVQMVRQLQEHHRHKQPAMPNTEAEDPCATHP